MQVKIKSFKTATDVQKFLEKHLPVGKAPPEEVANFLKALGLEPTDLLEPTALPDYVSPSHVENLIACSAPAPSTLLILKNIWSMYFMFFQGKLSRIFVEKYSIGL